MLFRDGNPAIVIGAPGGSVIISAVLQTIINIVDFEMSPLEPVTVPRIHCDGAAMGHHVSPSAVSFDPVVSQSHVVEIHERGR